MQGATKPKNKRAVLFRTVQKYITFTLTLALTLALLLFSRSPAEGIRASLRLCYTTVIPSVFPFMVISSFLINVGAHKVLGRIFSLPIRIIFGCSDSAASAVFLGFLCGFPIGGASAAALYDKGEISADELERILTFSNNPGAAFVIGGVGISLFNSARIGRVIYFSSVIAACLTGMISRFFYSKQTNLINNKSSATSAFPKPSAALTSALSESALNMLRVCSCVLFFSVPVGIVGEIFEAARMPQIFTSVFSSLLEMSGGVSSTVALKPPIVAAMVCAFAISWSGLSVHLQVLSVASRSGVSFLPYFISKLFQGLLSPLIVYLYLRFLTDPSELSFSSTPAEIAASPLFQRVFFTAFILSLLIFITKKDKNRVIKFCRVI